MATLTPILCAPCGYEKHNKIAKKWCTVCKEGLCEKCENMYLTSEMSEEHMLITIEDYQKQVKINQICEEHQRKYENVLNIYMAHVRKHKILKRPLNI
jgi:hypothetical protein